MISNDGAGQLSRSAAGNLHERLETVRRTTAVDVLAMLSPGSVDRDRPADAVT